MTTSPISTLGIDPNYPLAVYTCKQERCQAFVQDAGVPISKEMMVTTRTKNALNCRNMTLAWQESRRHPLPDHTWNNWKIHCTDLLDGRVCRDLQPHDLWKLGLCQSSRCPRYHLAEKMGVLLNNLANTSIQKNDTIDKLVAMNQQQAQIIADLTVAIAKLKDGSPPTRQQPGQERPSHWSPTKPR
jgi:hypothetical protein